MVIPVGDRFSQKLIKIVKEGSNFKKMDLGGCRFVDLIGLHGWKG
jgi:protein-L-isoaspartate(D-aspartate) O-methyltransferase